MYKVSVVIPVYNVENYIEETIESLLNQTLKEFEVIFVDDGSTDKSIEKIEKYLDNKNLKLIKQENGGPGKARNKGIELATGQYIVFVDGDDLLPENSLKIRYDLAESNGVDIVVGGTYAYDGVEKWPIISHFGDEGIKTLDDSEELFQSMGPCNKIFKSELIRESRFPEDIKYGEDQVFIMDAYIRAKGIYKTNENIYFYRQRQSESNPSLTDLEIKRPSYILEQVLMTWVKIVNYIDCECEDKELNYRLKYNYFVRLLNINIWPPFKATILNGDKEVQLCVIEIMKKFLENTDENFINEIEKYRWILVQGIIDRYLFIKKDIRADYVELVSEVAKKLNKENVEEYKIKNIFLYKCIKAIKIKPKKYIIIKYLITRKLARLEKRVVNYLKRKSKIVFNIFKCMPIKKDLVILASNKSDILGGNLLVIKDELEKKNNYKIKEYVSNDDRSFKECISMYKDFATAKYIILDDYYRQLYGLKFKKESEVIQVWHACGAFKKFGFSAIGKGDGNTLDFEEGAHKHYTKVITSSKNIIKEYSEAFDISPKEILPLGIPRTDKLLNQEYVEKIKNELKQKYPIINEKKVILYAPTFRGNISERKNFKLKLDPTKILQEIGEEYVLLLKLHPSVKNGLKNIIVPSELKNRIISMDSSSDVNDLIIVSDVIITDYSSVVFEAALLDKRILMYAYDKEEYLGERDFYYDYDTFVPGEIAKTNEEIIEIINKDKFDNKKVRKFREKFFDDIDGQASKRFVETIFK